MVRTLVIGYGNLDRGDDGVAYYVVNALRKHLGQKTLDEDDTGLEELGTAVDSVFLTQLMPELIDTIADYDQVIFIDAHVIADVPDLHCSPISPEYTPSAFTHHMTPAMVLMLLKTLHHKEPKAYLVSLRGWNFDFHRGLSESTEILVQQAVGHIVELLGKQE